jgi:hypothetical protein
MSKHIVTRRRVVSVIEGGFKYEFESAIRIGDINYNVDQLAYVRDGLSGVSERGGNSHIGNFAIDRSCVVVELSQADMPDVKRTRVIPYHAIQSMDFVEEEVAVGEDEIGPVKAD